MSWNAARYQKQHSYVWQHGAGLLEMLNPQPEESVLDLGCGTGQLAQQITEKGASVIGLDRDPAMITQAQTNYPQIDFRVADAADFQLSSPVDAVFSNAALHWVTQAEAAANCIASSLKPGGRLVAELGGRGNVKTILTALAQVSGREMIHPWYFPGLCEYVTLLEKVGFEVVYAHLFERPTPLGEAGLAGWLEMFARHAFGDLSDREWAEIVKSTEAAASQLYQGGEWLADYKRLKVVAIKSVVDS